MMADMIEPMRFASTRLNFVFLDRYCQSTGKDCNLFRVPAFPYPPLLAAVSQAFGQLTSQEIARLIVCERIESVKIQHEN